MNVASMIEIDFELIENIAGNCLQNGVRPNSSISLKWKPLTLKKVKTRKYLEKIKINL